MRLLALATARGRCCVYDAALDVADAVNKGMAGSRGAVQIFASTSGQRRYAGDTDPHGII